VTDHHHPAPFGPPVLIGLVAVVAAWAYLEAARRSRRRGRPWPHRRSLLWVAGLAAAAPALAGPIADAAHLDFRVHMIGHVLLGMLGPLLLVLAAPVTLALRALPVRHARRLSTVLRQPAVVALTHPVVAATLNIGGLWVLYRTGLYATSTDSAVLHILVHLHVLLAGCLFTAAIVGPDPAPHRPGLPTRATVLVLAVAAHNILAKTIYAYPPTGVDAAQAATAGQLMYYGAAPVELLMIVLLCREWAVPARLPGFLDRDYVSRQDTRRRGSHGDRPLHPRPRPAERLG
jgi:putative membrane protein